MNSLTPYQANRTRVRGGDRQMQLHITHKLLNQHEWK